MTGLVRYVVPTVVSFLTVVLPVRAGTLTGQIVQTTYFRSLAPDMTTLFGPVDTLVGPGIELTNFADFLTIDLSDTNILITATRDADTLTFFELVRFSDVTGTIPNITDVTINAATNFAGFDASRIIFVPNRIDVNLTALPGLEGQVISLDITSGPDDIVIPEPSSAALLVCGVALLLLGFIRDRSPWQAVSGRRSSKFD